jgi:hypothetical protein
MNDDEVVSEMNKMVAFIKQEAREKAREIRVKADEEFAIEKVRQPVTLITLICLYVCRQNWSRASKLLSMLRMRRS